MDEKRVTGEVNKLAGQVQGAVGDLTGDTKTQVEGRARETQGTAENLAGQAKDAIGQAADQLQGAFENGRDRLTGADEVYRQGNEAVRRYMEAAPLGTLLVAAGIGYFVGWLIHARR